MARTSKARGRKRVTKDLAPWRQAKGGKGEVTGLEPHQAQAKSQHTNGVQVLMADGSVRFV